MTISPGMAIIAITSSQTRFSVSVEPVAETTSDAACGVGLIMSASAVPPGNGAPESGRPLNDGSTANAVACGADDAADSRRFPSADDVDRSVRHGQQVEGASLGVARKV